MKNDDLQQLFESEGASENVMKIIIGQTKHSLYPMVRKIVGDHPTTDDVLQATYIAVFEKLSTFQWTSKVETWVYRIAMNRALDEVKKRKIRNQKWSVKKPVQVAENLDFSRVEAVMHEAIDGLPEQQKEVFVMRYFDDLSFAEMASKTGLSEGGLRSNYHHAKKKVKLFFEEKGMIS